MTQLHKALRLAEILEGGYSLAWLYERGGYEASAELRRQHALIAELESQLAQRFDAADAATAAAQQGAAYAALPDEREMLKHALWLASSFTVHRYLMSNAEGRWSGAEKATCHDELCCLYVAVFRGVEVDQVRVDLEADWMAVHDATQELTDHMDVVIGFPLKGVPDYDALAPKFFDHFHRLATHTLRASQGQAPAATTFCWATELAMVREPVTLTVKEAREVSDQMQRLHAASSKTELRNLTSIDLDGDQAVRLAFMSCRAASAFKRAVEAAWPTI